jgi:hypothetical protein
MKYYHVVFCIVFVLLQSTFCSGEVVKKDIQEPEHTIFAKNLLKNIESADKVSVAEMTIFPFNYVPPSSQKNQKISKIDFLNKFDSIFPKNSRDNLLQIALEATGGIVARDTNFNYKKYKISKTIPVYSLTRDVDGDCWTYYFLKNKTGYKFFAMEYEIHD